MTDLEIVSLCVDKMNGGDQFRPAHILELKPGKYTAQATWLEDKPSAWLEAGLIDLPIVGWITGFSVLTADQYGQMRLTQCGDNQIKYATPKEAVDAATPYEFEILNDQSPLAIFCILDNYCDDRGGVNIKLTKIT